MYLKVICNDLKVTKRVFSQKVVRVICRNASTGKHRNKHNHRI